MPLLEHKSKQSWREKLRLLRAAAAEAGRPDLMLANNEYGLGKASSFEGLASACGAYCAEMGWDVQPVHTINGTLVSWVSSSL